MADSNKTDALALRRKIMAVLILGARLKAGKTKKDCAVELAMSVTAYSACEDGRHDLSLPELELLANFLKTPVAAFFDKPERLVAEEPELPREQIVELRQRIIGALLRKARVEKGKSAKDVAEFLGLTTQRLTEYEFGAKPVPVTQLQELADVLDVSMSYFIDEGVGVIGEQELIRHQFDRFGELPEDVRHFVTHPTNISYLRVAQRLSEMTTAQLRNIAAAILDITY
ncbi:MAG: helix-turn-helix transcriptional regulator [Chloroflexi bacterium]|nr:helix-turn-helix transcriptional regulator [Chloroflexota bacterium]